MTECTDGKTQKTFDWSVRGHRLRLLDRVVLPQLPGTSPAAMLAVLKCLEGHLRDNTRCWPKVQTIADGTQRSRAAVKRALAGLRGLDLLIVTRTGRSSHYQIVWSNLSEMVPEQGETSRAMSHQKAHHAPSEGASCAIRGRTMSHQRAHDEPSKEAPKEAQQEPPPPPEKDAWREAEEEVAKFLVAWRPAVLAAKRSGCSPQYVLACVAYYVASAGAFGPGALHERLLAALPAIDPEQGWPDPRPPSPEEDRALNGLARVRDWCHERGQEEIERIGITFVRAARSGEFGELRHQAIARALWQAGRDPAFYRRRQKA